MPGLFDSIFKDVLRDNPGSLLNLLKLPTGEQVTAEDTELSASSRSADILLKVTNPDYLVQIEMQSTYDRTIAKRMLEYRVLCGLRFDTLPAVESVLLLLRPLADGKEVSGILESRGIRFTYHIIRLWEVDVAAALSQPVSMLPLAPLCAVNEKEISHILEQIKERLYQEQVPAIECREIWVKTRYLLGLKMNNEQAERVMGSLMLDLRDSSTYMATLEEGVRKGELEGTLSEGKRVLLRLGARRFGEPSSAVVAAIEAITLIDHVERLVDRVLDVNNWNELMS